MRELLSCVFKGGLFIFHFIHVICEALSEWSKNSTNGGWSDQQEPAIIHHSLRISKLLNFRINDKELKTYVESLVINETKYASTT